VTLLKTLHVAAAVLWLGNFAVTGVWALRAYFARDKTLFAFATREILFTDVLFTACFGGAVVASGVALAHLEGLDPVRVLWTRRALEIVIFGGLMWLGVLLPVELMMRRRARNGSPGLPALFAVWNAAGWLVTLALFSVIYLMIAKPV
jgi:uncharacterized membrane protein